MPLNLRSRILLFLVLFALTPLFAAVVINLPLVLDRVELFYRHAFLQNLRADFRDLDQHLASRDEMVRLLAKLPEPGLVMGTEATVNEEQVDLARASYTRWINRILSTQFDITSVLFMDDKSAPRFWLERDPESRHWMPTTRLPEQPGGEYLDAVLKATAPIVVATPVHAEQFDDRQLLHLQLLAPIGVEEANGVVGVVVITIDISGLVERNIETYWVHDDGRYLRAPRGQAAFNSAFDEFSGLQAQFSEGRIFMWQGGNRDLIWVPLLRTDDGRPLWVGRQVNRDPLVELQDTLVVRVMSIIMVLVVIIWLAARRFARRAERFGEELLCGIRQMLEKEEAVTFSWRGPRELRQLGDDLSVLADTHARNVRSLREHAREMEESNRYKSEFLANVSHELRTPLNSILLLSKLLQESDEPLSLSNRQRVTVIHKASRDLRNLIDNILDLSRMEAQQHGVEVERIDLLALLQELGALMEPQFEAKGLRLTTSADANAPTHVRSDPHKVRQILKNFLANAVKFTHEGQVEIALRPATVPYGVEISVIDSGIGIPPEKQQVIFEAFKQADGATTRRYGGTGLGLTISRELAHLLGGEIQLESAAGQGARFSLLLPVDFGQSAVSRAEHKPFRRMALETPTPQALPVADFPGRKVLLVENNVRSLLALSSLLEGWGIEVVVAGDEEELLETLEEEPDCDLILAAPGMFDDDGYARITAEARRQDNALPEIVSLPGGADGPPEPGALHALLSARLLE